jgi:hypothetical protein
MADPALEVRPDFASNAYRMVREALMASYDEDIEQAIHRLNTAWNDEHDQRVDAWNLECKAEAQEDEHQRLEHREAEEEQRSIEEAEAEKERKEAEKKKPKINDFNENCPPQRHCPTAISVCLAEASNIRLCQTLVFLPRGMYRSSSQPQITHGRCLRHHQRERCPHPPPSRLCQGLAFRTRRPRPQLWRVPPGKELPPPAYEALMAEQTHHCPSRILLEPRGPFNPPQRERRQNRPAVRIPHMSPMARRPQN